MTPSCDVGLGVLVGCILIVGPEELTTDGFVMSLDNIRSNDRVNESDFSAIAVGELRQIHAQAPRFGRIGVAPVRLQYRYRPWRDLKRRPSSVA
jgi:hypothetical protein